jgi:uroporphyrin-III C-methyltransferase
LNLTLVIYMGIARSREIQIALLAGGKSGATPVAVIQSATGVAQAQLITTLAELPQALAQSTIGSPAIIVIGDVVRVATKSATQSTAVTLRDTILERLSA